MHARGILSGSDAKQAEHGNQGDSQPIEPLYTTADKVISPICRINSNCSSSYTVDRLAEHTGQTSSPGHREKLSHAGDANSIIAAPAWLRVRAAMLESASPTPDNFTQGQCRKFVSCALLSPMQAAAKCYSAGNAFQLPCRHKGAAGTAAKCLSRKSLPAA